MGSPFLKIFLILALFCSIGLWACQGGQSGGLPEGLGDAINAAGEDGFGAASEGGGDFPEEGSTASSESGPRPAYPATPTPGGDDPRRRSVLLDPEQLGEARAGSCIVLGQEGEEIEVPCPPDTQLEAPPEPANNTFFITDSVSP